jgi:hypothetical protein
VVDTTVLELRATATARSEASDRREVDVRLTARLSDERELVLPADRGFTMSPHPPVRPQPRPDDEDLFIAAWCVGPDEKFGGRTDKDMADAHFGALAEQLRDAGVRTTPELLMSVPFRVVWAPHERLWPDGLEWH